jgi:hypothetical protein
MQDPEAILNFILSDVLNAPTEGDILAWNGKEFVVDGQKASPAQTLAIMQSAHELADNFAFKTLMRELKREGQRRIGAASKEWEDVRFGKACLYLADVLEKKVAHLTSIKRPTPESSQ